MAENELKASIAEAGGLVNAHVSLGRGLSVGETSSMRIAFKYFVDMSDSLERLMGQGVRTFGVRTPIDPQRGTVVVEAVEELRRRNPDVAIRTIGTFPRGILSRKNRRIFD